MSKQKIREWLEKHSYKMHENSYLPSEDLLNIIHQYTQDQSGWVSVKEEGDPMSGDYITYRPCAPTENRVATIRYSSHTSNWSGQYKVTHYMEKPLPPTEEA